MITGGGAMLKNLPQLVKYKTAMDVRIGNPNVHISGKGKEEINQPMYATSVGLILKGLEYLEENKTFARFGEKKKEPVMQQVQQAPPAMKEEPVETVADDRYYDDRPRGGGSFGDKLRNIWDRIIEATDEKLDDSPSK